jgi:hypothetical protein
LSTSQTSISFVGGLLRTMPENREKASKFRNVRYNAVYRDRSVVPFLERSYWDSRVRFIQAGDQPNMMFPIHIPPMGSHV